LPIVQNDVIVLPQKAVFEVQGKQIVYVVGKGNKVKSRIIETNGTSGLSYIVTSGLNSDEIVVIEGASKLNDGMEIIPEVIASKAAVKPANTFSTKK
jgi:membrane fusion protein (multidrug efflux system)